MKPMYSHSKSQEGDDINQKNNPSQAIATDTAILKLMNPTHCSHCGYWGPLLARFYEAP